MNPTIHDVARLSKTSKSTVSRYLNGQPVKKRTEETLKAAIKELGYHPNVNARRLVKNSTQTIGVVVDDISNNFYSGILRGIEKVANLHNYQCVYYNGVSHRQGEFGFLNLAHERQVDGLILISFLKRSPELFEKIKDLSMPVALIGDGGEGIRDHGLLSVDVNNEHGIKEIVHYLNRIGHKEIAFIAGPDEFSATSQRITGYKKALKELGLTLQPSWIVPSDWSKEGGYKAMSELINKGGMTAVIASNDETAIGALLCTHELGFRVPKHFSIAGFDDIEVSSWVYPPLTTVKQPLYQIGIEATEGLVKKMKNKEAPLQGRRLIEPNLVVRDSCMNLL
ncbi:transcriptional regulator, LacI family [Halobacillus dabanensis]|uniref:Transcriptional regulator, LacI family n=1 Tax=Halobacillus dabanensis TaxID=240302 RepID=A0A1I3S0M7_HALDA|nr:LacI family DNA-binding transcriptional regulator [Halobacillus dabanensis]SFJ51091.1 transcriptional regulator, LacI family [Halobacillus dabanensis]